MLLVGEDVGVARWGGADHLEISGDNVRIAGGAVEPLVGQLDIPCTGSVGGNDRRAARPVVLPGYELGPPRRRRGKQPDEGGPEEDSGVSHPCGSFSSVRKTQIAWLRRLVPLRRRAPCGGRVAAASGQAKFARCWRRRRKT